MYQTRRQQIALEVGTVNISSFMDRCRRWIVPVVLLAADYGAVVLAVWTTFILRAYILPVFPVIKQFSYNLEIYSYAYIIFPLVAVFFLHFDSMYMRRLPLWQQAEKIFKVTIYSVLFVLAALYFTKSSEYLSRVYIAALGFFMFWYLFFGRYLAKKFLITVNLWQIPVVLVGAGKTAEILMSSFEQDSGISYKVVGIIEDNKEDIGRVFQGIPVIGSFSDVEESVKRSGIKDVLVAAPGLDRERLVDVVYKLQPHVRNIAFVPDLFGVPVRSMEIDTLFDEKMVLLNVKNNMASTFNRLLKRVFDLFLSVLSGIIISPILIFIAVLIYIDSPGKVFFAHRRIGSRGNLFDCYKFRTMVANSEEKLKEYLAKNPSAEEEWKRDFKLKNDPRITKIGNFLRSTSLDELPQILNVIKGEMSLVGPRPIVKEEIERYSKYINDYYMVRPGITGFWQVSGRNDVDYNSRVKMDSWYIRNWSLWLDIILILKTFKVVWLKKGAY